MAKVTPLPGGMQKPPRVRGIMYVRGGQKWGWVASKWPTRYRRTTGFAYQAYKVAEFSISSTIASGAMGLDQDALQNWCLGSRYTWRDLMIRAQYGRLIKMTDINGNVYQASRDVNPNPQQILDLVDQTQGNILYRSSDGWFGLDPSTAGYVLTTQGPGADPIWAPPGGGGSGSTSYNFGLPNPTKPDLTGWTWEQGNQSSSVVAATSDGIQMTSPAALNGLDCRCIGTAAPATPWTFTIGCRHNFPVNQNYFGNGLYLANSTSTKLLLFFWQNSGGGTSANISECNSVFSYSGNPWSVNINGLWSPALSYMRVEDDGTNLNFYLSNDGRYWQKVYTMLEAAWLPAKPDRVGLVQDPQNSDTSLVTAMNVFDAEFGT